MFIPHKVETLEQHFPWANWLIVIACSAVSLYAIFLGGLESGEFDALVLDGYSFPGIVGHILLHADLFHLVGNMIFLMVFGNAICTNTNNWVYLLIFTFSLLMAAVLHIAMDGSPAIGASGAINGVVGVTLAMYPVNRIYLLFIWFPSVTGGFVRHCSCDAWIIICFWFIFDLLGVAAGDQMIAYWAHIGGFLGGLAFGLIALQLGWIKVTRYDNRTLLEILRKEERD